MKHKSKIIFLLFVIIGTLFASCTMEEEAIKNHNYSKEIKIYQKTFDELLTDKEFSKSFNKLPKIKSVIKSSTQGKTVMEQQYGFTITNTPVRVMQVGNITSYTFHIERDVNDNTYFENLVVQNDSVGNTSAQIIKYTPFMPMTSFAEHNSYSFEGNTEFSSIIYDDTPVNATGKVITVCRSLWGTRCTANSYGYCVAPSHIPFSVCLTQNCLAQQFINETCTTYDDGEPEETPVGGGGGSSYNTGGGNNPVYSDPVCGRNCIAEAGDTEPCDKIKNGTNSTAYKTKFKDLNTPTNYNKSHETGFFLVGNDYVDGTPHPARNTILIPNNSKNGTHIHNNKILTYSGTTTTYDSAIKMLSVGDVEALIEHIQPQNTDPKDAFVVMASNEGIFAISILESIPWTAELEAKLKEFEKFYKKESKNIVNNYTTMTALQRKNFLEKMFLKGLSEYGLENKVGLFEGEVENETDPNINNYNIKWTRKTLKKVFLGYNVQASPCD